MTNQIGTEVNDSLHGTEGNDTLEGLGGNDILFESSGNDILNGGEGTDTADYSDLNVPITLERAGRIDKGSANGTDRILGIETIIGSNGQANSIDGSTGTSGVTSFIVNLNEERLTVQDVPLSRPTDFTFNIQNFVNRSPPLKGGACG